MTRFGLQLRALTPGQWLTTLLVLIVALYLWFVVMMLALTGPLTYVGLDYRQVWCSVQFARAAGFEHLYDPATHAQFHVVAGPTLPDYVDCDVLPVGYLPVFFILFVPFAMMPPAIGLMTWSAINLLVFVLYVYRFARAVGDPHPRSTAAKLVLAWAFFINLVAGQANVWLLICLGESVLAYLRGGTLRAGIWLGGLLLKPTLLILLLPGLLIRRELRMLAGFGVASIVLMTASLGMAGMGGMENFVRLLVVLSGGAPSTYPEAMMNWRAFGVNAAPILGPAPAWAIAAVGMVLTAAAALLIWFAPPRRGVADYVVALLGCLAATGAVAWHSHVYTGLPVVGPLIYLLARGRLPMAIFHVWLVLPAVAFFVAGFGVTAKAAHPAAGLATLATNVLLVGWAVHALWLSRDAGLCAHRAPGDDQQAPVLDLRAGPPSDLDARRKVGA